MWGINEHGDLGRVDGVGPAGYLGINPAGEPWKAMKVTLVLAPRDSWMLNRLRLDAQKALDEQKAAYGSQVN